jgi:hypothetical protein
LSHVIITIFKIYGGDYILKTKSSKKKFIGVTLASLVTITYFGTGLIHANEIENVENIAAESSMVDPRYSSSTEDWRLFSSSEK